MRALRAHAAELPGDADQRHGESAQQPHVRDQLRSFRRFTATTAITATATARPAQRWDFRVPARKNTDVRRRSNRGVQPVLVR